LIIEIEQYVTKNYYELQKICVRITENSYWADDLLNDVLLQLWSKPEIKLDKLDDASIKYYIIRCITTNWYSETSPFFRKVKRESSLYNEVKDIADIPNSNDDIKHQRLLDVMEEEFSNLGWFHKEVFSDYLILGSYRRVSEKTRIPLTSIKNYVHQAKNEVKQNVFKRIKDE
jgi:DNA-directed RNA polymerase specialized sigma24 family protein